MKFWLLLLLLLGSPSRAADHAVILMYHHVSESTPPSTSVSPAQFEQHLDYLQQHDYQVMPLDDLLQTLLSGGEVPDRSVAITFDDAYISVYQQAAPRLQQRNWPFTVFLASDPLDQELANYMSWAEARKLLQMGGNLGGHSASHAHLVEHLSGESESDWQRRVTREIDFNLERILANTGVKVKSFAYPYGEYNNRLKAMLGKRGLYGLAQQSGAVGRLTDPHQIPRFPLATGLDDMQRFKTAINSRPLPVTREHYTQSFLRGRLLTLELDAGAYEPGSVRCYAASGEPLEAQSGKRHTLEVTLPATRAGRNKINCTAPATDTTGEFFWHSYLWMGP